MKPRLRCSFFYVLFVSTDSLYRFLFDAIIVVVKCRVVAVSPPVLLLGNIVYREIDSQLRNEIESTISVLFPMATFIDVLDLGQHEMLQLLQDDI